MMKSKYLLQILVVFVLLFSPVGNSQAAFASSNSAPTQDALVVNRDLTFWDATYIGYVSSSMYEKWHFVFTESHDFVVAASPITGGMVPLLVLTDANGNELARDTNSLTSFQPAGDYYVQVQPDSGSGFYILTIRQAANTQPAASTTVSPSSINVGESATTTVSLDNVPATGYTGAEFSCTYDPALVQVGNIAVTDLFGADAAVAINDPQDGSFIVAIAGSNGNMATTSGPAFTFSVMGLQAGDVAINCTVRVSQGDNTLTSLPSTGTTLTVAGSAPSPTPVESSTPTPVESPTVTSTPNGSPAPTATDTPVVTSTPNGSTTPTATDTPVETSTPVESATPVETSTPVESPTATFTPTPADTATATPIPDGSITGQVNAGKAVTVSLYAPDNTLVTSVTANADGTFSLTAPAGDYNVTATASGYLSAQGAVTVTGGAVTTLPTISLLAGDIDGNNVIDQMDAMTIGMNYNTASPDAADLNNDGNIDVLDLELLAQNYRQTGPQVWQ